MIFSLRRAAFALLVASSFPISAVAQQGTAQRIGLGTSLGNDASGAPRFAEGSGWNSTSYDQEKWAVEYGTELNASSPWTAVFQSGRKNAGLTAAANKLTLDLGGSTYVVSIYVESGRARGGKFIVVDRGSTGAYLKLTNGTLRNQSGLFSETIVGSEGRTGRLFVENATLEIYSTTLGRDAGSHGILTVEGGGAVRATTMLYVGLVGRGTIDLRGANSSITAGDLTIGNTDAGEVVVGHETALLHVSKMGGAGSGDLVIQNPVGNAVGLRVDAGTVRIDGALRLATGASSQFGSVVINGGAVEVAGNLALGQGLAASPNSSGGKIFLNGGRLEVAGPSAFAPQLNGQFHWKDGTLAFSSPAVTLSEAQLRNYTHQGRTYGGGRAAGVIATGQTLEAEGTLTFGSGSIGLAGGTIKAANGLVVNSSLSGYGTIDAVVSGTGAVAGTGIGPLAIGALGGANSVTSNGGELRVGHLGLDATHTGAVGAGGQLAKVGGGTQIFKGSVRADGGVRVEAGRLTFDGGTLTTAPLSVSNAATARFRNGAVGTAGSVTIAGEAGPAGRLEIDGPSTRLTAASITNHGWIELTDGGTLTVGSPECPGQLVNTGHLINRGTLNATVAGAGWVTGDGTFGGVIVGSGATLAPGNSPGTMSVADLTLGPGGSFELEIANAVGTAGIDWDVAAVGDLLALTATALDPFTIVLKSLTGAFDPGALAGFDPTQPFSWKFASVTDPAKLSGFDASKFTFDLTDFAAHNSLAGGTFEVAAANDGLYAKFAPQAAPASAPEPSSLLLLAAAGAAAAGWKARRRRRASPSAVVTAGRDQ